MADDVDAPHAAQFSFGPLADLKHAISQITTGPYLAAIAGGKASWVVWQGTQPLAIVAQQWPSPRFLDQAANALAAPADGEIYFQYLTQQDPETVYARHASHR